MSEIASEIHRFLESEHSRQIAFLAELVKTPSDNPPGDCAQHAEMAARLLEGLGLTVERHPVPEALVRKNGMITATNLVVRQRFGDGPVIALNAHGDVVPPGDGWTRDPYGAEIVDDWMYGRGVAVSKSDFVTYTWALLALKALNRPLRGTIELHFTYDEEAGGISDLAGCSRNASASPIMRSAPVSRTPSSMRITAACISKWRCAAAPHTQRNRSRAWTLWKRRPTFLQRSTHGDGRSRTGSRQPPGSAARK